jgi:hypothetical protein
VILVGAATLAFAWRMLASTEKMMPHAVRRGDDGRRNDAVAVTAHPAVSP